MFQPGDVVKWTSGAGKSKAKEGIVVARVAPTFDPVTVIEANQMWVWYRLDQISEWRGRHKQRRRKTFDKPRYFVAVNVAVRGDSKEMLYLPQTHKLSLA